MSAAASVVAAVVLGGGCGVMKQRGSRIPVRCGVERVVVGGERGGVVVGGGMRGSRIPVVVGGSSVRYETSKSLKAGLGSRIPVMKGSGVRYVLIIIPFSQHAASTPSSILSPLSLSSSVKHMLFMRLMLTIIVAPNTGRALLSVS